MEIDNSNTSDIQIRSQSYTPDQSPDKKLKQTAKSSIGSSYQSQRIKMPDFFLYTTLNQNQTKDLCKAKSNLDQRKQLQKIFKMKGANTHEKLEDLDNIILDFHYINYAYCRENQFSNEKISTLMAIMDFMLNGMVKNLIPQQRGIQVLKDILYRHSLNRPPFRIFVFTEAEALKITNFVIRTFFRHFSLYEYAYAPRVDLTIFTVPKDGEVESQRHESQNITVEKLEDFQNSKVSSMYEETAEPDVQALNTSSVEQQLATGIDWAKVGKLYRPDSAVESIISNEVDRLRQALGASLDIQDEKVEEGRGLSKTKGKR